MKLWGKFMPLAAAAALVATFSAAPMAAQQTGTVTGLVTDATSGRPLESAQVHIPALGLGVLTNPQGRYLLTQVPSGTHELRVELIGYTSVTQQVTVSAGQAASSDFQMNSTALRLQELVVTGVAGSTPRIKLPFTVERVDFTDMPVPAPSADGLIAGKVPGAKVVRGSGQPGSDGSIMLRGPTTITGSQTPLVIVDGVISDGSLADVSSLDIESIELVKGAAAASLYGSRAQNGVVQITTKRGSGLSIDQSRITVRNEYGTNGLEGRTPLSQQHAYAVDGSGNILGHYPGEDPNTTPAHPLDIRSWYDSRTPGTTCAPEADPTGNYCTSGEPLLMGGTTGKSFQSNNYPSSYTLYDQIDALFNPGSYYSGYVAVEGRTGSTNYRASFTHQAEAGVVEINDGFKLNGFRVNLDHQVLDNLNASISTYYARSRQDDLGGNPFYNLAFQAPFADLRQRAAGTANQGPCGPEGCYIFRPDPKSQEENPLYRLEVIDNQDTNQRFQGSVNVTWAPLTWFELEGTFSLEQRSAFQANYAPAGLLSDQSGVGSGSISRTQNHSNDMNGSFTASINRSFGDLTTRTKLRYSFEDGHNENFTASGSDFIVAGVPVIDNTQQDRRNASSSISDILAEGYFFITSFDYQGKYVGDVLVRRDGSSLFGPDERWQTYYRASAAWRMAQEDWWSIDAINEFKLRYSLGTAGGRPRFANQYETFTVGNGSIRPNALGNRFLKPELSTEQEVGLEMVLYNKISTGVTYAFSTIEDQLLNIPLPGFVGFASQWQNAGTLESTTFEAYVETAFIDTPDMTWTSRMNFDRTTQEITSLGRSAYQSGNQYIREGEGLGTFYGSRWASVCGELANDAQASCGSEFQVNDEGLLVWVGAGNSYQDGISKDLWGTSGSVNGVTYRWGRPIKTLSDEDGDFQRMGSTTPDFNLSWGNTVRMGNLSVYALLDGEFGKDVYNQTRAYAYRDSRSGDQDQGSKPQNLWKNLDYYQDLYNVNQASSYFVEDGTFVKLREAAITYRFATETVDRVFGGTIGGLSLNLIGRNLLTITDYQGYDPEAGSILGGTDNFGYPNFRTFSASLEILF